MSFAQFNRGPQVDINIVGLCEAGSHSFSWMAVSDLCVWWMNAPENSIDMEHWHVLWKMQKVQKCKNDLLIVMTGEGGGVLEK